jgi:uncharacterized membrane protein
VRFDFGPKTLTRVREMGIETVEALDGLEALEADDVRARRLRFGMFMLGAGIMHFVAPGLYERIVPRWLGDRRRIVAWSGVAEIACGALTLNRRTAKAGGWMSAALLVAVFPANVQAFLDAGTEHQAAPHVPAGPYKALMLARMPLQIPPIRTAVSIARSAS